jgi:hypothetical protein
MYPVLNFTIKHKHFVPAGSFVLITLFGCYGAWRTGHADVAAVCVVAAFVGAILIKLLVEVLELLADMLLPK